MEDYESNPGAALDPARWLEEHGDILFRYALGRVRDRTVAEDLVQETFVAALRSQAGYGGRASERTWLVAILRHKIIDHLRRQCREQPLPLASDDEAPDETIDRLFDRFGHWRSGPRAWADPRQALENTEFWEVFNTCLAAMPTKYSAIYTLHTMEEQPGEEVCQVFQITPSNLWVILHRARLRLRECLEANWFGHAKGKPTA